MAKPKLIRADTFDLEGNEGSAARQRPTSEDSIAPHQAETLRKVAAETAEDIRRIPRSSWNPDQTAPVQADPPASGPAPDNTTGNMRQHDALAVAQNGGLSGHEADDGEIDADQDVDLEDDLMDKISSSPSIEDGGSTFALPLVASSSLRSIQPSAAQGSPTVSSDIDDPGSSSPYLESPEYLPLESYPADTDQREVARSLFASNPRRHHHHHSCHCENEDARSNELRSPPTDPDLHDVNDEHIPDLLSELASPVMDQLYSLDPRPGNGDDEDDLPVPYESDDDDSGDDDDDDDDRGLFLPPASRFVDSGWGGECLQDTEDIDFDFVYALHTFVATVEGQANATKGDTMVLLDDSNSYWWLVRVVKDSSIGYLPAEHIETPTERLARLNKHRNIDLSSSMLGDQPDKTRNNGLMSAMRRKKTKTVQFAAPTYVDYSDVDYSTEEEDADAQVFKQASQQQQQQQQQQDQQDQQAASDVEMEDETAKVEPLKPKPKQTSADAKRQESGGEVNAPSNVTSNNSSNSSSSTNVNKAGARVIEVTEGKVEGPKKTSDGTVRDSFFKDDTVETKKITLTPNLLRDDNEVRTSVERDARQRPSLDKDKDGFFSKDDKKKKKDKEKDKKQGGLRGFFSRKDKKSAKGDEDDDSFGKRSMDADAPDKDADEDETLGAADKPGPQRNPSKLQKHFPRTEPSPTRRSNSTRDHPRENGMNIKGFLAESRINNVANTPPASMRLVTESPKASPETNNSRDLAWNRDKGTPSKAARPEPRPAQVMAARSRMDLDDFSDDDFAPEPTRSGPEEPRQQPKQQQQQQQQPFQTSPGSEPPSAQQSASSSRAAPTTATERLSESPVHVSPVAAAQNPPLLVADNSSQEGEDHDSPASTPSPELIERYEADEAQQQQQQRKTPSATTPTSASTATAATTTPPAPQPQPQPEVWDDASLRAFFDSGADVRDLLVVVYDKNDVDDIGSDHPLAKSLFMEQNAKLAEIATRLDNMLGDWLARKQRLRGTV
ncbi:hypothetical protein VTJ04DRAFT_736 [Mycothermus thermophilus]|uniref:uncharacterized protein n=1 Tax=Humicola insolens TaxID=85995 RepID=UPI0037449575